MSDAPPDHLASNPKSKYYHEETLERGVGIRFNGKERQDVDEYCVSEGWIRVAVGKARDRFGYPITMRLNGIVEAFFHSDNFAAADSAEQDPAAAASEPSHPENPTSP